VKAVVVGGGSWGTAFSCLLRDRGHDVTLACRDPEQAQEIADTGRNPRYLSTADLTGVTAATIDAAPMADADGEINSSLFRVYVNTDLTGVEFCGAAKNVIALAAGGVDGLGLGDNAKAGVITRGVAEMTRLGSACGARPETFAGLAGMGDLMVSCWSRLGRNRAAGELIAHGRTPEEAVAEIGHVVEGITSAPVLRDLAHREGIELPITEAICGVLAGTSLQELIASLMGRQPKGE